MSKRVAVIDRDLCTNVECGYVCEKVCPVNRMGQDCIVTEKDGVFPVISEPLCIGCGICTKKCPMKCIWIINLARESGDPVFQYGINSFRLYGLPLPKDGAVSLVGKNGIGKTTALRLLARQLDPNFAIFDHKLGAKDILEKLGLETRRYFQQAGNEIKVSIKPQYVDKLRGAFKGKVKDLLAEIGGKSAVPAAASRFNLSAILDREIGNLSGGELQKVSIAAACMKDAEIYYFDEPTNYLDIEERLRVAVALKELSESKKVMLAEHDMIILDYVSSYVYLFFGDENVYGVVSGIKNVRAGLNEYISGFMREENVKFRERELKFVSHSEGEVKTPVKFKYSELGKKFGKDFSFTSESGEIRKGEILGLVGKNALGKSLFIKMLAGAEKPDSGEGAELKVSYKPQYISADDDVVVSEMFRSQSLDGAIFEEAKRRLNVGILMEKKLTELSGGELQRIALTLALSRQADVYLFDEPSAFLDIEQRFAFAELLRHIISESGKSAFVVDHDIVFLDSIANRLIVFDGESSVKGHASAPMDKREGMNSFLKITGITIRRDKDTFRPRINKPDSALDREQKEKGEYYYTK